MTAPPTRPGRTATLVATATLAKRVSRAALVPFAALARRALVPLVTTTAFAGRASRAALAPLVATTTLASTVALAGCARCSGESTGSSTSSSSSAATTAAPPVVALLPPRVSPPAPWEFASVRGPPGVALPDHCRYRAPLLKAPVPITTHFAADARAPGVLAVAETQGAPAAVVRSGVLALLPQGETRAGEWVPWPDARGVPRLAKIGERWVGAWHAARPEGGSEVVLFHDGAAASLGVGDAFVAADLACGASRCALLTSRVGRVAPAGADVVLFDGAAQTPLRTITIEPAEGTSGARPFGLVGVDGPLGVGAVLVDDDEAVFWKAEGDGGATAWAHVPAKYGVLEAMVLGDRPVILAHGNVVDEQGCAREGSDAAGAKLQIGRAGEAAIELRTPGAPSLAALRPLGRGALAVWLAPLGCGAARHVVFAVVLDAAGVPSAAPMPVADGETFAAAASGADVDLWIRRAAEVFWLRMTCEGPAVP